MNARLFLHERLYDFGMGIVRLAMRLDPREYDTSFAFLAQEDDMCPNCVTPWKCNGPHLGSPEGEQEHK